MAQPSGQVLLDTGGTNYAATSFWYAQGTGLWDAKGGTMLTKTGTAGVASEGGANVLTADGSTYYSLATALALAGQFSLLFKARTSTDGNTASMVCGSRSDTSNFVWLASSGTQATVRVNGNTFAYSNSASATAAVYAVVRGADNLIRFYKNGSLVGTSSGAMSGSFLVNHILSGYTGTSFIHNGSLEFMHIVDGVAFDATAVSSYYSDPYQDLVADSGIDTTFNGTTLTATASVISGAFTGTSSSSVTLTSPAPYQTRQRSLVSNNATFTVSGSYTGTPTAIQSRFAGGTWTTLIASPSGGTFSSSVTLATGQGTFEVRFSNDTGVTDSAAYVTVGDVYIVAGQSNHAGRAPNKVDPVFTTYQVPKLGRDGVWRALTEATTQAGSFDEASGAAGSYIGALSTRLQSVGVPVAFCPVAQGSTTIANWARYDPDPTNPSFLYGAARIASAAAGGNRGVLWLLGESDAAAGQSQAAHESALNDLVNDWFTDTGGMFFVVQIVRWSSAIYSQIDAIRAAHAAVAASNSHVAGLADGNVWQAANNVHYQTTTHINDLATAVSTGMLTAFYPEAVSTFSGKTLTVTVSLLPGIFVADSTFNETLLLNTLSFIRGGLSDGSIIPMSSRSLSISVGLHI